MNKFATTCAILMMCVLAVSAKADGEYCYALALQGGGDKGAYQAGALAQIIEDSDPSEIQYDVVSGVSVGSINAGYFCEFPKGQELDAVESMLNRWDHLSSDKVYKNWKWGGPVRGIFKEKSLYNSSPLREYLQQEIKEPKRGIIVAATNAHLGTQKIWDENDSLETLQKAILASSSFPGFFEPVDDLGDGVTYYDGGNSYSVNIFGAINKCVDYGFDYDHIMVDVIMNSGAVLNKMNVSDYKTLPMVMRYLEIERYYDTMELLERALQDFEGVNFRYLVVPSKKVEPTIIPMDFSHKEIQKMIKEGREDAKKVLSEEHGANYRKVLEFHQLKMNAKFKGDYAEFLSARE
eukprot:CAMPEP_0197004298 /NCGR_PEP_ID=MMETSP1380-20130617/21202_1 /TAXON_ID=5936 /ORGANISM="Euplotes crassus, Strain CT5" /LENGTH=349 /DNA_ID=CAMNT_0042423043 /DNA_START=24 /DNA_END=1073 /DNA_ORIENTATION=+